MEFRVWDARLPCAHSRSVHALSGTLAGVTGDLALSELPAKASGFLGFMSGFIPRTIITIPN